MGTLNVPGMDGSTANSTHSSSFEDENTPSTEGTFSPDYSAADNQLKQIWNQNETLTPLRQEPPPHCAATVIEPAFTSNGSDDIGSPVTSPLRKKRRDDPTCAVLEQQPKTSVSDTNQDLAGEVGAETLKEQERAHIPAAGTATATGTSRTPRAQESIGNGSRDSVARGQKEDIPVSSGTGLRDRVLARAKKSKVRCCTSLDCMICPVLTKRESFI